MIKLGVYPKMDADVMLMSKFGRGETNRAHKNTLLNIWQT